MSNSANKLIVINDCSVLDRILVSPEASSLIDSEMEATYLGCSNNFDYLIGWKEEELESITTCYAWFIKDSYIDLSVKENSLKLGFVKGLLIDINRPVKMISSFNQKINSPQGMSCSGKYCGAYNEYAVANSSDGKYYCYSCRGRPTCLR